MFRVDVATIAKPKTLMEKVRGPRKGYRYPTKPRISALSSHSRPGLTSRRTPGPTSVTPTFH